MAGSAGSGDCCENPGDDLVPDNGVVLKQGVCAHEEAVFGEVVGGVDGVGAAFVGDAAVKKDLRARGIFGVELAGAFDEPVVALKDVGGGGDVGRNGVIVSAIAVDDEGEADGDAPIVESPREVEDGAATEGLSEEDDVGTGGFFWRKCAVPVEIEGFFDEFVREFELVVFHRLNVDAGEFLAFEDDGVAADAAGGVVPAFPATDDAEDEGFAGLDGEGHGEVVEGLVAGVGGEGSRESAEKGGGL